MKMRLGRPPRLINLDANGDKARPRDPGPMDDKRHAAKRSGAADQAQRDRELDAWMDRALGVHKPDPEPIVRDL
jgi:hypothetical protein